MNPISVYSSVPCTLTATIPFNPQTAFYSERLLLLALWGQKSLSIREVKSPAQGFTATKTGELPDQRFYQLLPLEGNFLPSSSDCASLAEFAHPYPHGLPTTSSECLVKAQAHLMLHLWSVAPPFLMVPLPFQSPRLTSYHLLNPLASLKILAISFFFQSISLLDFL